MGSHSVTCHPTQANAARLSPSHAGWYSIYLPRRDGRLSWPSWLDSAPAGSRTFRSRVRRQTAAPPRQPATGGPWSSFWLWHEEKRKTSSLVQFYRHVSHNYCITLNTHAVFLWQLWQYFLSLYLEMNYIRSWDRTNHSVLLPPYLAKFVCTTLQLFIRISQYNLAI